MAFTEAPSAPKPATSSGISVSMLEKRGKVDRVRFTINAEAQERLFKASLATKKAKVLVGSGDDAGHVQIRLDDNGDMTFSGGPRGAASLVVGKWLDLPHTKRPAGTCDVVAQADGIITIKLPSWAIPTSPDGKAPAAPKHNTGGRS